MRAITVGILVSITALVAIRGVRLVARGLREAGSLDVIRGLRGYVIALATAAFAAGVLLPATGWIIVGLVFLGEELYETGVLALLIRSGDRQPSDDSRENRLAREPSEPMNRRSRCA